jgi:hypothetical protein
MKKKLESVAAILEREIEPAVLSLTQRDNSSPSKSADGVESSQ